MEKSDCAYCGGFGMRVGAMHNGVGIEIAATDREVSIDYCRRAQNTGTSTSGTPETC
jgi:hypothetical protein